MSASRVRTIFIKPGELVIVEDEALITTVLGSCVSLVLHHAETGMAGLCHAVLPQSKGTEAGYHFVDQAFNHLLRQFFVSGKKTTEIKAELYGGADMFTGGHSEIGVGRKNIAAALNILRDHNLKPTIINTGGLQGRKLVFYTGNGRVQMNLLPRQPKSLTARVNRVFPKVQRPLSTSSPHQHPEGRRSRSST